ncbi:FAD/NAD(P)-binding protein [Streptomyces sp. NPDC008121]|uniref:FAD/NAD(P)-binding protein n=1 Tax=Streptomyces sp. NPDC008121 TaxID=3364809 RepID=UPI0036E7FCC0
MFSSPAPLDIAVIGSGPRGLSVLERLACRLVQDHQEHGGRQDHPAPSAHGVATSPRDGLGGRGPRRPVRIHLVDNAEIGAGRVWRTDQDPWFTMNTVVSQITMYSGDADDGPARPGAGPSLGQWLAATAAEGEVPCGPNDYASRAQYGNYLKAVYRSIVAALPPGVELVARKATVTAVRPRPDGGFLLDLDDAAGPLAVDRVALTTGHPRNAADPFDAAMEHFAARHDGVHYLRGDSAADMPLGEETIPAGSTVAIRGLGLSFYDVMLSLTVGRGGVFKAAADGTYAYVPSGREPHIVAGSRSGLPIPARGRNQKPADHSHRPRFLTSAALTAARAARAATTGSGQLDFAEDVLPLLLAEVAYVYYTTARRTRPGAGADTGFARALADALHHGHDLTALLREAGLGDLEPLDLKRLARPFDDAAFTDPDHFRGVLLEVMRRDLDQARLGNADGPLKAALDVLRDIRNIVREAVDFGGLLPASHTGDFERGFLPMNALLSAGPPLERVEQLYALITQGVVEVAGPGTVFTTDEAAAAFSVSSAQVAGSVRRATVLIDARIPTPDLQRDTSPLTRQLLADRLVRPFTIHGPDSGHETGGLDVTPAPYHVRDAEGAARPGLFALGIPTEHTRWFTQVGSSRPGTGRTLFYRDADALALALLDPTTDQRPLAAAGQARSTS